MKIALTPSFNCPFSFSRSNSLITGIKKQFVLPLPVPVDTTTFFPETIFSTAFSWCKYRGREIGSFGGYFLFLSKSVKSVDNVPFLINSSIDFPDLNESLIST